MDMRRPQRHSRFKDPDLARLLAASLVKKKKNLYVPYHHRSVALIAAIRRSHH